MTRRLFIVIAASTIAVTTGGPPPAKAAINPSVVFSHGAECVAAAGAAFNTDFGGIAITSSTSKNVFCPISNTTFPMTAISMQLYYGESSTTNEMVCSGVAFYADASQTWSANRWTCATDGGCSSATTSFSGNGRLTFPTITFATTPVWAGINCTLPPFSTGVVRGYQATCGGGC
jgi:hypothetical protein